jgi:predicted methyltransferase
MLANKEDPHSIKVFDPSIKDETDRFAYRFVKPRQIADVGWADFL